MLAFILALIAFPGANNSAIRAKSLVRAVESRYSRARTLQASFFESYRAGGESGAAESGTVYFAKPGRMRWEYESPDTKLFLVDGKNVWLYVPADRTASRAKLRESSDWRTPLALLTGKARLNRLCGQINVLDSTHVGDLNFHFLDPSDRVLHCLPPKSLPGEGEPPFREILFEIAPDARLVRVLIREPADVETEFRFGNWQENVALPESKFHFTPPPGVSVVDEQDLTREVH